MEQKWKRIIAYLYSVGWGMYEVYLVYPLYKSWSGGFWADFWFLYVVWAGGLCMWVWVLAAWYNEGLFRRIGHKEVA